MKKKIILISAAVIALAAICIIGYTLAYFTDTKTLTNTFTIGNIKIELTEPTWNEEESELMPGVFVEKNPTVKNTGDYDAYVRIEITLDETFYNLLVEKEIDLTDLIGGKNNSKEFEAKLYGDDWYNETGYTQYNGENKWIFHYTKLLKPGAITPDLFTHVMLPGELFDQGDFDGVVLDMNVTAQAIQADGFDKENENGYKDALAALEKQLNPPVVDPGNP